MAEGAHAQQLYNWSTNNGVQWQNAEVQQSEEGGFRLVYNPTIQTLPQSDLQKSWREIDAIKNFHQELRRPSSNISEDVPSLTSNPSFSSSTPSSSSSSSPTASELEEDQKAVLLRIPYDMVLCADYFSDYAKASLPWRKVFIWLEDHGLDHVRYKMTAFLCMSWIHSRTSDAALDEGKYPLHPWRRYTEWLPKMPGQGEVSQADGPSALTVPTTWTEEEQMYLIGSSIEEPLRSKMKSLRASFDIFKQCANEESKDGSDDLNWFQQITFSDWVRFDACFRSRSLEVYSSGTSMVPCLDMVNHSDKPNAWYSQVEPTGDILLIKSTNSEIRPGEEITINYAAEHGAGEVLFSYGFVPRGIRIDKLTLPLDPLQNGNIEPEVYRKKFEIYRAEHGQPLLTITHEFNGLPYWECPFAFLLALEVDFKVDDNGFPPKYTIFHNNADVSGRLDRLEDMMIKPRVDDGWWRLPASMFVFYQLDYGLRKLERAPRIPDNKHVSHNVNMARELRGLEKALLLMAASNKEKLVSLRNLISPISSLEI